MKLKGKAIFELTNVETGEKRVVKEENMVTNAYEYLVESIGLIGGPIQSNVYNGRKYNNFYTLLNKESNSSTSKYARRPLLRYTHGLLLFSDRLEEDVDHVYATADDPELTGVGAELAYIGSNSFAGSYNATESGEIENGYKHVWDFTTSQANGDIGCACLTPLMSAGLGGGVGFPTAYKDWYGTIDSEGVQNNDDPFYFPYMEDHFLKPSMFASSGYIDLGRDLFIRPKEYFAFPLLTGSRGTEYVQNEYDINGNVVQQRTFNRTFLYKKSIDINIYRFPYKTMSIFDKGGYESSVSRKYRDTSSIAVYNSDCQFIKTVTVPMPTGLANLIPSDILEASINTSYYWPTQLHYDEGFMYISFMIPTISGTNGTTLMSGEKIYVWKINMNTFESNYFTITNTTGQDLLIKYTTNAFDTENQWIINNDYTILFSNPTNMAGYMWIIDNATGSTIKQVINLSDETPFNKSTSYINYYIRNNILYFIYDNSSTGPFSILIINLKTGYAKFSRSYTRISCSTRTYGTKLPMFVNLNISTSSIYCRGMFYIDPQLLMTINNLENVVTKTSAETMKVTYIITKVPDNV